MGRDDEIKILSYEEIYRDTKEREEEIKEEFHLAVLRGCGDQEPRGITIMDLVTLYRMKKLGIGL